MSKSLKVLCGGLNNNSHNIIIKNFSKTCDLKTMSLRESDIKFNLVNDNLNDILKNLKEKENWQPDIFIWWLPEYNTIINGIEDCPIPSIAIVMDWNVSLSDIKDNLSRFDWIFTDKNGVDIFQKYGYENVLYWRVCSYQDDLYFKENFLERPYDVTFIGHFNHNIHREREKWLKKVALLDEKYNVKLLTGVYGDKYRDYYNNSKIVFNYNVRGEANLRTYEASICGALVFVEESNREIYDFFENETHCIYYNDENILHLLEYYLDNPDKLNNISENGYQKIQTESYYNHFKYLIKLIDSKVLNFKLKDRRVFNKKSKIEKDYLECLGQIQGLEKISKTVALEKANQMLKSYPNDIRALNNFAFILANNSLHLNSNKEKLKLLKYSLKIFDQAKSINENEIITRLNIISISQMIGDYSYFEKELIETFKIIETNEAIISNFPHLIAPRIYDIFKMGWEKITTDFINQPNKLKQEYLNLIKWKIYSSLAKIKYDKKDFSESKTLYEKAIKASYFKVSDTILEYAYLLEKLNLNEKASEKYEEAFKISPLNPNVWQKKLVFLKKNNPEKFNRYKIELKKICLNIPHYKNNLLWINEIEKD